MNDFETRVARALNASVDERVGTPRPAPPFRPELATGSRRRARWVFPLLAAACVAAVAAGAAGIAHLGDSGSTPPGGGSSHPSGQQSSSSATTPVPRLARVRIGDALIAVPSGWVTRKAPGDGTWCLQPASAPRSGECRQVLFSVMQEGSGVNVDGPGGVGDAPQCLRVVSEQAAPAGFGGRDGEWRRFHTTGCGAPQDIEDYVVPTVPAFVLSTTSADPAVHLALRDVAQQSTLPRQQRPLRLTDFGVVRSVQRTSAGVRVALLRLVRSRVPGQSVIDEQSSSTTSYLVPTALFDRPGQHITVGSTVGLLTDGNVVTGIGTK